MKMDWFPTDCSGSLDPCSLEDMPALRTPMDTWWSFVLNHTTALWIDYLEAVRSPSLNVLNKQDWKTLCWESSRCVTNHASGQGGEINGLLNPSGKTRTQSLKPFMHFIYLDEVFLYVSIDTELQSDIILESLNDSLLEPPLLRWLNRESTRKWACW